MPRNTLLASLIVTVVSVAPVHAQTYYEDVRPVLTEQCMACHSEAGVAWSMEDAEETYAKRSRIARMVESRRMPPWLAEPGHEEYRGDISLSPEKIALIQRWAENGFQKGEMRADPAPDAMAGHGFEAEASISLFGSDSYLPNQEQDDDYRCFVSRWDGTDAAYLTGFRAVPGNLRVAHHVVVYAAQPEMYDRFAELDEAEEGLGYECFGGSLPDRLGNRAVRAEYEAKYPDGVRELSRANFWLAHWAPGMDGHQFPEGTGILLQPGSVIITQMHYYSADAPGESDVGSRLDFQLEAEVERPAFHFAQTNGEWLGGERNGSMVIPAGEQATFSVSNTLGDLVGLASYVTQVPRGDISALEVHSANLHMHAFGHSGRIWLSDSTGQDDTLLSVPRWDLAWQRDFTFLEPKIFDRSSLANTTLTVECTFENDTSGPVYGGYGSYDEMCFNFSYIAVRR